MKAPLSEYRMIARSNQFRSRFQPTLPVFGTLVGEKGWPILSSFCCVLRKDISNRKEQCTYLLFYFLITQLKLAVIPIPVRRSYSDNETMLRLSSSLASAAFDQRDDITSSSRLGYSLDGDGRHDEPPLDNSSGSFRTLVKSANATLQKSCTTLGSSINQNIQQSSTILHSVGNKISTLHNTMNINKDDHGIFANQPVTSWSSVKENVSTVSTVAATKVVQVAQSARHGLSSKEEEVSFNYQLMSDE